MNGQNNDSASQSDSESSKEDQKLSTTLFGGGSASAEHILSVSGMSFTHLFRKHLPQPEWIKGEDTFSSSSPITYHKSFMPPSGSKPLLSISRYMTLR
ncbi:MAG: hypothetical protein FJY07_01055 [Bacteroidetes bacterium]|nr:hypothetical protein [Bacteroidota bacterium]